jgi:hypothetical protein
MRRPVFEFDLAVGFNGGKERLIKLAVELYFHSTARYWARCLYRWQWVDRSRLELLPLWYLALSWSRWFGQNFAGERIDVNYETGSSRRTVPTSLQDLFSLARRRLRFTSYRIRV